MKTPSTIEKALWDYIDEFANPAERIRVEKMLATDPAWKQTYDELLLLQATLEQTIELEEPSMRFSKNVMENISRYQVAPSAKSYINKKIIYGIGGFFLIMILCLLLYVIGQTNWSGSDQVKTVLPFQVPTLNLGNVLSPKYINAFLFVNILLGLLLMDRFLHRQKSTS